MFWRRKSSEPVQLTPELPSAERAALYRRYFAFRRGYQAGAAGLPHRVAPFEDYDAGYKQGRLAAVEICAQWLREHGLPDPTTFPYLPLPAANEPEFPPLPEDAETIFLTREELEIATSVEIDLSDLVELHHAHAHVPPYTRVVGDEITGEGMIELPDISDMTMHGFKKHDFDTSEFDGRRFKSLSTPPPIPKK